MVGLTAIWSENVGEPLKYVKGERIGEESIEISRSEIKAV